MTKKKTVSLPNGDSVEVPFGPIAIGQRFTTQKGRVVRHHNVARKNADTYSIGCDSRTGEEIKFICDYEFFTIVE